MHGNAALKLEAPEPPRHSRRSMFGLGVAGAALALAAIPLAVDTAQGASNVGPLQPGNNLLDLNSIPSARLNITTPVYVTSTTALAALDPSKDLVAVLINSGRSGTFEVLTRSALSSTEQAAITTDNASQRILYIVPTADTTKVYKRVYLSGNIQAQWAGVTADGATDDLASLNASIVLCNALGGGMISLPIGTMLMSGSPHILSNVYMFGQGQASTIKLANAAAGNCFDDGSNYAFIYAWGASNFGLSNFQVDGNRTHQTLLINAVESNNFNTYVTINNLWVKSVYGTGLAIEFTTDCSINGYFVTDITGGVDGEGTSIPGEGMYIRAATRLQIGLVRGTNIYDHLIYLSGGSDGTGAGTIDVLIEDAMGYSCGSNSQSSAFNTAENVLRARWENCHAYNCGIGFTYISVGGLSPTDIEWSDCTSYSTFGTNGAYGFSATGPAGGGVITRTRYNNCKAFHSGSGLAIIGAGFSLQYLKDLEMNDCTSENSNDNGFELLKVDNFRGNVRAVNNSKRSAGTYYGVQIGDGTAPNDCSDGDMYIVATDTTSPKTQAYGCYIRGTSSDIVVKGKLTGNLTGTFTKDSTVAATAYYFDSISVPNQIAQSFCLRITNTAGTLQNEFGASGSPGNAGSYFATITGATISLVNTPTGTDSSTAFANGGKISSASTNVYIFNTAAAQTTATLLCNVSILQNTTATAGLTVRASIASVNVNGTTLARLQLTFYKSDGTAFALTTANIGAGAVIDINFNGYVVNAV